MASASDVVVVGSGVIGCCVTYELTRRGARVTLLDDRAPGMGATQASAGMLAPHLEVPNEGPLLDLTTRGLQCYDQFVARVSQDSGVAVEYRRTGSLSVAAPGEDASRFARLAEVLRDRGVAAQALDGANLRREEPSLASDLRGGLLIASHGYVSATALTEASAQAARLHGARLERSSRVCRIRSDAKGIRVETADAAHTTGHVVIAAGAWSGSVEVQGAAPLPLHPVRGQLLYLQFQQPVLRRITWTDRCYLVPRADGSVLVGATVEHVGFDERTTVAGVSELLDAARAIVPCFERAVFAGARAGLRPKSADDLPVIGWSVALPEVMYATGHYRNGILLAPLTAELVADALLDGRVDALLASTNPARFGVV